MEKSKAVQVINVGCGVNSCCISPDSHFILSCSVDGFLCLHDRESQKQLRCIGGVLNDAIFSPNGQEILVLAGCFILQLLDKAGNFIQDFQCNTKEIRCFRFFPDGSKIVIGSSDSTARILDKNTGQVLNSFKMPGDIVKTVAVSFDGGLIACSDNKPHLHIFETKTGKILHEIKDENEEFFFGYNVLEFSPDGNFLVGCYDKPWFFIWDMRTGKVAKKINESETIYVLRYSPDGQKILSGGREKGSLSLWDANTGQLLHSIKVITAINEARFSPDGNNIITPNKDRGLNFYNLELQLKKKWKDIQSGIKTIMFSSDNIILTFSNSENILHLWDLNGKCVFTMAPHVINAVAFSLDGQTFAALTHNIKSENINIYETSSFKLIRGWEDTKNNEPPSCLVFSNNNKWLLTGSFDKCVCLWDRMTGDLVQTFEGHQRQITSVCFSKDDKMIASSSWDNTAKLWNSENGQLLRTLEHEGIASTVAFSPNSDYVTTGVMKKLNVWNLQDGRMITIFQNNKFDEKIYCACTNLDGEKIYAGCEGQILECSVKTGKMRLFLKKHRQKISCISISKDGNFLLSGSRDSTIVLTDLSKEDLIPESDRKGGTTECACHLI